MDLKKEAVKYLKNLFIKSKKDDNMRLHFYIIDMLLYEKKAQDLSISTDMFILCITGLIDLLPMKDESFDEMVKKNMKKVYKKYIYTPYYGVTDSVVQVYILTKYEHFKWKDYLKRHKLTQEIYDEFKESINAEIEDFKPKIYPKSNRVKYFDKLLKYVNTLKNNKFQNNLKKFMNEIIGDISLFIGLQNATTYYEQVSATPRQYDMTIDYLITMLIDKKYLFKSPRSIEISDLFSGYLHTEDGLQRFIPLELYKYDIIRRFMESDDDEVLFLYNTITPELYKKYRYTFNYAVNRQELLCDLEDDPKYDSLFKEKLPPKELKKIDLSKYDFFVQKHRPAVLNAEEKKTLNAYIKKYMAGK